MSFRFKSFPTNLRRALSPAPGRRPRQPLYASAPRIAQTLPQVLALAAIAVCFALATTSADAQAPGGLRLDTAIGGDVSTTARRGSARTIVGGGAGGAVVGGDVATRADGGRAQTEIGRGEGPAVVGGDAINHNSEIAVGGGGSVRGDVVATGKARLAVGGCGETHVSGDVLVSGGSLELGCVCAGRRNGRCCVEFYQGVCVYHWTLPTKYGCPPGYLLAGGRCRLFSDFTHRVGR